MKTIVMTGGTSGFGATAASRMAPRPDVRVLLGARSSGPSAVGAKTLPLDLASLDSVRSFARAVIDQLDDAGVDALVLNAGVSLPNDAGRTVDGFETTFAVNHLAHYLLLRLLAPHLATGATVVLTTSGTHDPATKTFLPVPPRHADAALLARPDRDPEHDTDPRAAGGRAYTSSKLCNVLTARSLAGHRDAVTGNWRVLAFDPGPTPGTGLLRETPAAMRSLWWLLSVAAPLLPRFNSRDVVGATLADLVLGRITPPPGEYYARVVANRLTWIAPSELARRDDVRDRLWHDSARLANLSESGVPSGTSE